MNEPAFNPDATITPFDGMRADGTMHPPVRLVPLAQPAPIITPAAPIAPNPFELPESTRQEIVLRVFQPKIEKARSVTSELLEIPQLPAEQERDQPAYNTILDGLDAVQILIKMGLARLENTDSQAVFAKESMKTLRTTLTKGSQNTLSREKASKLLDLFNHVDLI